MANANIFQQFLQQPRSVVDYSNDYAKADQLRNANAMQALSLQQAGDVQAQRNALRALVQGGQADLTTPVGQAQAISIAPDVAPAMVKSVQEGITSGAAAQKDLGAAAASKASAGKTTQDTEIAAHQQHLQALSTVNTSEDAVQWMVDGVKTGTLPPQGLPQALQALQAASATPDSFAKWKDGVQQSGMALQQQLEMTAPKPTEVRLGNVVKTVDMNPRSKTFGTEVTPAQQVGVSPDTVAIQAGENSRAAAQRATQLQVAGMGPNGTISPALEAEAQMVASGRAAPPTGMAATRPAAAALMARVSQINPDYDATTYGAKVKAAKDFTSGPQGNQMRAFQVASDHLDQLETLATALNNGNYPLVNRIANAYGVQTGQAPAAVFNAVRQLVGPEVVNAVTAGGGSANEREEASKTFDPSSSPDQFLGTIGATRNLMKAKYNAMLAQRRQAGLPDSTLPAYGGAHAAPAPAAPGGGWQYLGTAGGGQ